MEKNGIEYLKTKLEELNLFVREEHGGLYFWYDNRYYHAYHEQNTKRESKWTVYNIPLFYEDRMAIIMRWYPAWHQFSNFIELIDLWKRNYYGEEKNVKLEEGYRKEFKKDSLIQKNTNLRNASFFE